jgi:hypothetical protein
VNIELAEYPGKPFKPNKSMRRVLVAAWGADASTYAGNRVTLYCDPTVQFGNDTVGGTRISHMTGIDKPLKVPLLVKRGKSAVFTVQPLKEAPPTPARDFLAEAHQAGGDVDLLRALYGAAQKAGAPQDTLNAIRALATPAPDEAPAS